MQTRVIALAIALICLVAIAAANPVVKVVDEKKRSFGPLGDEFLSSDSRFKKAFGGGFLDSYHRFRRAEDQDENMEADKRFSDFMSSPRFKKSFSAFLDNYHRFRRSFNAFLDNYHRFRRDH